MNAGPARIVSHGPENWGRRYARMGHTGYQDAVLYRYDQPVRLRAFGRFLGRATEPLASGGRALDIGCGTGDVISLLRQAGLGVDAIDVTSSVVRDAARRFSKDGDVRVMEATVDALPFEDAAFSLVTCVTVLQHLEKPDRVLRALEEVRRVLAPDGRFVLLEGVAPSQGVGERTDGEWRRLFESAGWAEEATRRYAPWGPGVLQRYDRLVSGRSIDSAPQGAQPHGAAATHRRRGLGGAIGRARRMARVLVPYSMWPLDHVLRLAGPPGLAHHHMYALRSL